MVRFRFQDLRRLSWYVTGLLLFFAPFAYYQKALLYLLDSPRLANIHTMCLRTPLLQLMNGNAGSIISISTISFLIVLIVAFITGPFFCGRLCPTGALPEYLSKLWPKKWQVNWYQAVNPVPVRYGFLLGFLVSPFLGGTIAHAYCNFNLTEKLLFIGINQNIGLLTSTLIITAFLWLGLFGLLARGGRGFCSFFCPVGALQSLVHGLGSKLGFTYRIVQDKQRCNGCGLCAAQCPMGAWQAAPIRHEIYNCITCRQCEEICPTGAIALAQGTVQAELKKKEATSV